MAITPLSCFSNSPPSQISCTSSVSPPIHSTSGHNNRYSYNNSRSTSSIVSTPSDGTPPNKPLVRFQPILEQDVGAEQFENPCLEARAVKFPGTRVVSPLTLSSQSLDTYQANSLSNSDSPPVFSLERRVNSAFSKFSERQKIANQFLRTCEEKFEEKSPHLKMFPEVPVSFTTRSSPLRYPVEFTFTPEFPIKSLFQFKATFENKGDATRFARHILENDSLTLVTPLLTSEPCTQSPTKKVESEKDLTYVLEQKEEVVLLLVPQKSLIAVNAAVREIFPKRRMKYISTGKDQLAKEQAEIEAKVLSNDVEIFDGNFEEEFQALKLAEFQFDDNDIITNPAGRGEIP